MTPTKSTPAATPATSAPAAASSSALATVPPGLPIAPEEWAALSETDRAEAIALYTAEAQETVRDLALEFPKITIPTGAGQHWALPDGEAKKDFSGVVVAHFKARAYWPLEAPISNNPPSCSSFDGRYPVSGQGPTGATQCAACPLSQYGTGKEGRGQACKERLNVFVMMQDSDLPRLLALPPTSIKPFSRYARSLIDQKPVRPLSTVITTFALEKKTGGAGPDYSIVAPRASDESLSYAEVRAVLAMRKKFEEAMSKRGITEAEAEEMERDPAANVGGGTVIDHDPTEGAAAGKGRREDPGF